MRFHLGVATLVTIGLAAFAPGGSGTNAVTGQAHGSATYHMLSGQQAEVQMTFGNFSGDVPELEVTFTSPDNWLAEHQPVNMVFSNCNVTVRQLECRTISPHNYLNVDLIGVAVRPGHFEYTIAFWSVTGGQRRAITASDGRPLTVSWTEDVSAS